MCIWDFLWQLLFGVMTHRSVGYSSLYRRALLIISECSSSVNLWIWYYCFEALLEYCSAAMLSVVLCVSGWVFWVKFLNFDFWLYDELEDGGFIPGLWESSFLFDNCLWFWAIRLKVLLIVEFWSKLSLWIGCSFFWIGL